MSRLTIIVVTAVAASAFTQLALAQKEIPMPTEKGNLTVIFNGFAQVGPAVPGMQEVHLQASLRNDTQFTFRTVMFELNGYDANGNNMRLCGIEGVGDGGCAFELYDPIQPGQTLPLKSPGDFAIINTSRQAARVELKVTEAPYFIKYDVQSDPVASERFTISPTFGLKGIGLEFRNKSSDVIEVAWDLSVYIDEDGNSSRLIRGNVNLAEKDRPQPNTVVPPGTKLLETVFPVDHVQEQGGKWTQIPILPDVAFLFDKQFLDRLKATTSWVHDVYLPGTKQLAGKEVRLFLRLLVDDQKQNVTVRFKIAGMTQ